MRTVSAAATQENETGTGARYLARYGAENGPPAAGNLTHWPMNWFISYDEITMCRSAIPIVISLQVTFALMPPNDNYIKAAGFIRVLIAPTDIVTLPSLIVRAVSDCAFGRA